MDRADNLYGMGDFVKLVFINANIITELEIELNVYPSLFQSGHCLIIGRDRKGCRKFLL